MGYEYFGNDLSEEQILANIENAKEVLNDEHIKPVWTIGDSLNIDVIAKDYKADIIFSCPPYADLEKYSDDERDLSNMDYSNFILTYKDIIYKSCQLLKENRFAVFVVGDVRDKNGFYYNFVSDTIQSFLNAGLNLYNEIILVNTIGSLAIRAGRNMVTRKVGKQHQNVLVFYKGDPKIIKENYPIIDVSYLDDIIENE